MRTIHQHWSLSSSDGDDKANVWLQYVFLLIYDDLENHVIMFYPDGNYDNDTYINAVFSSC